jgi:phospholipid transport system transporter-binding protein
MTGELQWQSEQQTLILLGDLDRGTLLPLWQQREILLADKNCIDVSQLGRVDSSGLALLVHFREQRLQHGVEMKISGITDRLRTLIELYNLQQIIPADTVS